MQPSYLTEDGGAISHNRQKIQIFRFAPRHVLPHFPHKEESSVGHTLETPGLRPWEALFFSCEGKQKNCSKTITNIILYHTLIYYNVSSEFSTSCDRLLYGTV